MLLGQLLLLQCITLVASQLFPQACGELFGSLALVEQLFAQLIERVLLTLALLPPAAPCCLQPVGLLLHVLPHGRQLFLLLFKRLLGSLDFFLFTRQRFDGLAGDLLCNRLLLPFLALPLEFSLTVVQLVLPLSQPEPCRSLLVVVICRARVKAGFAANQIAMPVLQMLC